MALRERRGKKGRKKKQAIENLLTGSAVTEMHFSIQGTHPCRTSKTGLRSLSILTGSGQHRVCDVVWNSKAHCLCRALKQQHQPMEHSWGSPCFAQAKRLYGLKPTCAGTAGNWNISSTGDLWSYIIIQSSGLLMCHLLNELPIISLLLPVLSRLPMETQVLVFTHHSVEIIGKKIQSSRKSGNCTFFIFPELFVLLYQAKPELHRLLSILARLCRLN